MKGLKNKVGIVTGCGGGIGQAVSLRLAQEGAKLVLVDFNEELGQQTLKQVNLLEIEEAIYIRADVSKSEDVQNYIQAAIDSFGRIDILHNNAGIEGAVNQTADYSIEAYDQVIAVNQKSVFLGMKYALQAMKEQKCGSIINTSSVAGMVGSPNLTAYVASKHAVAGMTKVAANEYGSLGIRVNAICPGPIDTEMGQSSARKHNPDNPEKYREWLISRVPSGRSGRPEEVASLVAFLASEEAPYINGAMITIDGSLTAI